MIKLDTLYKWDKGGKKIMVYDVEIEQAQRVTTGLFPEVYYKVHRKAKTGFEGKEKLTSIDVKYGLQKRSVLQQAELEAKSFWNKKKDEGYKTVGDVEASCAASFKYSTLNLENYLRSHLPKERTDANGVLKPMKCTAMNDTKTGKILEKVLKKVKFPCDAQPKLDGVRCFARKVAGNWFFTSSSGKSYDAVCQHLIPILNMLNVPDGTILDGELYRHGIALEMISGWCRTQYRIPQHDMIQFHVFDMPSELNWIDRCSELGDAVPDFVGPNDEVQRVRTYKGVTNLSELKTLHDTLVADGYEGIIIRNFGNAYQYGIRASTIFKLKAFQDAEFVITGAELGSRGIRDMVFNLVTKEGKPFKAKPMGDDAVKEMYWKNLDKIVGKKGTVNFLTYSLDNIPQGNTVFKAIRDYE